MKQTPTFLGALVLAALTFNAAAYKEVTHDVITRRAAQASLANDPDVLRDLFLGEDLNDPRIPLPKAGVSGIRLTPHQLIAAGVREEDENDRALNHFFDPQRGGIPLRAVGREWGKASPRWALEDQGQIEGQEFSYRDASEYLYRALTGASEPERADALGRVFEALGHVVHHVQDMHQPQHVRNDEHCDDTVPFFIFSVYSFYYASGSRCEIFGRYRPSAYEQYVSQQGSIAMAGYPVPDYGTFNSVSTFWETDAKGGAEFTSHNFVSAGTNFTLDTSTAPIAIRSDVDHERPRGADAQLVSVDINDPSLIRRVTQPMPMAGDIAFVATPVVDSYMPGFSDQNDRASTLSIWYDSVRLSSGEVLATPSNVFTLNSITYQAAAERLIPRAAAYSTGLINYFFRGRIEIGLPAEGIYGILDHATTSAAGQGFDKLKLELRNASPDGVKPSGESVPQAMHGGTLVAVVKYTLNSCYQPDLSGDFAVEIESGFVVYPAGCTLDQYFAGEELVSQSAAILAASLDKEAADFEFDFSSQPIPVNARDLRIQVVYTGQLGAEEDGIAFGGRDISEPTHLMVYNNSDYYLVDGKFYTPQEIRSTPALADRVKGLNIDPSPLTGVTVSTASGRPITDPSGAVAANGYVRVAVLADIDAPFALGVKSTFQSGGTAASTLSVWANETVLRGDPAFITPLAIYRGPRTHFVHVVFKANNNAPMDDSELVTMSSRTVSDPGPTPIPVNF